MLSQTNAIILVVDSDAITLTGVAAVLNMSGYEVHCAQDRPAALKAADDLTLDLVICDVDLEDVSGLDLCRELREREGLGDVPVIFVSNNPKPDIVRKTHEAGGFYYLRKPFDPDVIVELVEKALWMPHLVNNRVHHDVAPKGLLRNSPSSSWGSVQRR